MSKPERRTRENGCELEPYTNWPLILGAVAFIVLGVGTVGTMAGVTAITAAPKAVYRWITQAETPVARVAPTPTAPIVAPAPVVEEREPLAQSVVVEHVEMLGKPRVETAASLALERMTFDRRVSTTLSLRPASLRLVAQSEEELMKHLLEKSKAIDIGNEKDLVATLTDGANTRINKDKKLTRTEAGYRTISALIQGRTDLDGLPLVDMKDCALPPEETLALSTLSRVKTRSRGDPKSPAIRERHGSTATLTTTPVEMMNQFDGTLRWAARAPGHSSVLPTEIPAHLVRPLLQVFEVQPEKSRFALPQVLALSKSGRSARALVQLAVFDLSERVRAEAVKQLVSQDAPTVRAELLAALRHPWAPAAVHAARAIDRLDDKAMIPELKKLLDQPDPSKPFQEKGTWYVRELVRVNHLQNCLLCHPPAGAERSTLSGPVPLRDREIPVVYYGSRERGVTLVNASTVYLRQDFSVLHSVKEAKPWPELQRFDYLVRTRQLRGDEIPKKAEKSKPATIDYPQREAVQALLEVLSEGSRRPSPDPDLRGRAGPLSYSGRPESFDEKGDVEYDLRKVGSKK